MFQSKVFLKPDSIQKYTLGTVYLKFELPKITLYGSIILFVIFKLLLYFFTFSLIQILECIYAKHLHTFILSINL